MAAPNSANPGSGTLQSPGTPGGLEPYTLKIDCAKKSTKKGRPWDACMVKQMCKMAKVFNESRHPKKRVRPSPSHASSPDNKTYVGGLRTFVKKFGDTVGAKGENSGAVKSMFNDECQYEKWKKMGSPSEPPRSGPGAMNPDHVHDVGLGGPIKGASLINNLAWADAQVNTTVGACMRGYDPSKHGEVVTNPNCKCPR